MSSLSNFEWNQASLNTNFFTKIEQAFPCRIHFKLLATARIDGQLRIAKCQRRRITGNSIIQHMMPLATCCRYLSEEAGGTEVNSVKTSTCLPRLIRLHYGPIIGAIDATAFGLKDFKSKTQLVKLTNECV